MTRLSNTCGILVEFARQITHTMAQSDVGRVCAEGYDEGDAMQVR
jgi:hypothetical protein